MREEFVFFYLGCKVFQVYAFVFLAGPKALPDIEFLLAKIYTMEEDHKEASLAGRGREVGEDELRKRLRRGLWRWRNSNTTRASTVVSTSFSQVSVSETPSLPLRRSTRSVTNLCKGAHKGEVVSAEAFKKKK